MVTSGSGTRFRATFITRRSTRIAIPNKLNASTWTDSMIGKPQDDSRIATLRLVCSSHWQKPRRDIRNAALYIERHSPMNRRQLGKSGLTVSEIGLGCMGMSQSYGAPDDAESIRTIHRALDLGVTFLDTADAYGKGGNETLVGRAIRDRR